MSGRRRHRRRVQVYISHLRKTLGRDRVQTKAPGYRVQVQEDELDLERFQRLMKDGDPRAALALWRGPPLAEFAYARFAHDGIARLEELWLACLEQRIELDLAVGTSRRARRRARGARRQAPTPRAPQSAADARPLPLGETGRGARYLSGSTTGAGRRARNRARPPAPRARTGDPEAGPVTRSRSAAARAAGRRGGRSHHAQRIPHREP